MSRLDFGPAAKEMEVTDIATGHFVFAPAEGEEVSFSALDEAIRNAGYEIEAASITVAGAVTDRRHLETPGGQLFHLTAAGAPPGEPPEGLEPGREVTVRGSWSAAEGVEVVEGAEVVDTGQDGDGGATTGGA
ncbi:MAG: hypothetical protein ACLF0P_05315 [Thermoanaerobaculia bacterium]